MIVRPYTSLLLAAFAIPFTAAAAASTWQLQLFADNFCTTLQQTINGAGDVPCTPINVPDNTQFAIINGSTIGTCSISVYDNANCATPDIHSWYALDWGWVGLCSRMLNTGKIMSYKATQC